MQAFKPHVKKTVYLIKNIYLHNFVHIETLSICKDKTSFSHYSKLIYKEFLFIENYHVENNYSNNYFFIKNTSNNNSNSENNLYNLFVKLKNNLLNIKSHLNYKLLNKIHKFYNNDVIKNC
jgi:hypothetical protein